MRNIVSLLLVSSLLAFSSTGAIAQTKKKASVSAATKQSTSSKSTKSSSAKKGSVAKTSTSKRKSSQTSQKKKTAAKKSKKKTAKAPVYANENIRGLQTQRAAVQKKIREQEGLLRANKADVKKRLDELFTISGEIDQHQKKIDGIEKDLTSINGNISMLQAQLATLEQQLQDRKVKYLKSMRYLAKTRTIQDKLMFIFSAKSLTQMYRRLRFVREYATYQRAQGEMLKDKQQQVTLKHEQLETVKGQKNDLLYKGKKEKSALEGKQTEQQAMVTSLKKQQKTIQSVIADQRNKDAALNAQIEKLIAEEVAKAKARAAEEAKRKAAEVAEAKRRREAELARKKAAAEAAARENARRIQEAKEREARLKAEAAKAAAEKRDEEARRRAEQAARRAEAEREAAERKAEADRQRNEREVAKAKAETSEAQSVSSADRQLNQSFEQNRGRLPMPASGRIVTHFGQYNVEGLNNVRLDSKGINIKCGSGASVRCIFNGEISKVFNWMGVRGVLVRHGQYISVYSNLASVSVSAGQKVSTGQQLGTVDSGGILQFQLYKGFAKLNPEAWLR